MARVRVRALVTALATASVMTVSTGGTALAGAEEVEFTRLINRARTAHGLEPLRVSIDLVDHARRHTERMIAAGGLFHSSDLAGASTEWEALGENVGRGPDPGRLHAAFMASPGHRQNVLGDYDWVGVAAYHDAGGVLYVTVAFERSDPSREGSEVDPKANGNGGWCFPGRLLTGDSVCLE